MKTSCDIIIRPIITEASMQGLADKKYTFEVAINANKCEIYVYEVESGDEITTFPIPASNKWYRIEVWPSVGKMEVGDETKLAISYTASGLVESEFLLINGSTKNYYWPYSGTSAQDANYVIITMVN